MEACLDAALAAAPDSPTVLGEAAAIRAGYAAYHGDDPRAIDLARAAVRLLPPDHHLRGVPTIVLGTALVVRDDPLGVIEAVTPTTAADESIARVYTTIRATCLLGEAAVLQGRLHEAERMFVDVPRRCFVPPLRVYRVACSGEAGMAAVLYERNDLAGARAHIERGLDLARYGTTERPRATLLLVSARVRAAEGDFDGTLDTLARARQFAERMNLSPPVVPGAALAARLHLATGDLESAARRADGCGLNANDPDAGRGPTFARETEYLSLARVHVAQGTPEAALPLLARLLDAATSAGRIGRVIEIHTVRALAFAADDNIDAAMTALEAALSQAEPEGYVRVSLDEGPRMRDLLRLATSRGVSTSFVSELLSGSVAPRPTRRSTAPVEALSPRELEVLRLLATGAPNQRIAETLVVGVTTVKTHVRNVLAKLDATNRTEAVARARELGVL